MSTDHDSDTETSEEDIDDRNWSVTDSPTKEDLLPLLDCPVCFELPLPPIRTCVRGHILCASCSPKLANCPLCLEPIGLGRNFFAEDFINKSAFRCKFSTDGCTKRLLGDRLRPHLVECHYRPIKCPVCPNKFTYRNFENHMKDQHAISKWDLNDGGGNILHCQKQRVDFINCDEEGAVRNGFVFKTLFATLFVSLIFHQLTDYIESLIN